MMTLRVQAISQVREDSAADLGRSSVPLLGTRLWAELCFMASWPLHRRRAYHVMTWRLWQPPALPRTREQKNKRTKEQNSFMMKSLDRSAKIGNVNLLSPHSQAGGHIQAHLSPLDNFYPLRLNSSQFFNLASRERRFFLDRLGLPAEVSSRS